MLTITRPDQFDWSSLSLADCAYGNAIDAFYTLTLYNIFEEKLKEFDIFKLHHDLLAELIPRFSKMEFRGLDVDTNRLDSLGEDLSQLLDEIVEELKSPERVNEDCNFSSNKQLCELLYTDEEGYQLYPPQKTKSDGPSVSAESLKILIGKINDELGKRETQTNN